MIQLFDSWVGALSRRTTALRRAPLRLRPRRRRCPHDPFRHRHGDAARGDGGRRRRRDRSRLANPPRCRLGESPGRAVQGNLDPAVLLAPWDRVEAEALDVLARAGGRPGHIFNLGHGVFPDVDPDVLTRLAALVRERSGSFAGAQV